MNPRTTTNPTAPADPEAADASDAEETVTEKAAAEDTSYDLTKATGDAVAEAEAEDGAEDEDLDLDGLDDDSAKEPSGLGAAAASVVAAGLGVVALTGSWTGKVAAERETLIGQIKTSGGGTAAQQISEIYGDAWHSTALVNGLFALLALLVGIFALVRPAFGVPSAQPQPGWVRAVATAGIALGVLGLLISVGMYFDLIVALPTATAAQ
ncbi:hypothetical protein OHU11_14055 [Streptomyces sp. NBC_00257]|uniref:hypothetical protein n=1 Tax=unclassified Streptomyces TaxID=2593676 RepID=UPI00225416C3|nr:MULTISPECIES: hypothetical protein [unclassified Streptomyces]MCX5428792.1 hypothetical protein [Streptomyces sp. NBC_00062]